MTNHSPDDSSNALGATQGYPRAPSPPREEPEQPLPSRVGRYAVRGLLGRGGFADVLLAHDEQLNRQVAIKLPRRDRFQHDAQLQAFIEEARAAAGLQHPGIVAVFDVGFAGEKPFIVLEYIRGRSLAHLLEHESLTSLAAAQLVAEIAEALAHAHEQGFVHRDIKPQNILLDTYDHPHIADFGLAFRHREQVRVSDDVAGTTHYMSPEQVRGENHRIDGRTDLWALGVVFYRMLTWRLPFVGSSAHEVFQKILYSEPVAPREIDATIPSELERICLRCLCQQMSGRYRSASDLSDELTEWIRFTTGGSGSGSSLRRRGSHIEPPDAPVIPRGLRSFTQEDRDFFLKLIPGPRDRDGLPTPVRFWKNRIEERDADETFRVGLLYGPSGCGKSSLIKAGVLPRLNSDVEPVYIEASSRETETRILRLLHRKFKSLSPELDLADSLCELREQAELRSGKKVLLVLDQFEQWLHQWQTGADAELVRALLQCDGGNVQCVLMVRDDFWLPVSRFMRQLDLGIVDGTNAMLVDSFDPDHAQRVLRELGVAYKRLPSNPAEQTSAHGAFISQATADLAEDNRLYPIRLAVFVEMVKDREWTPATLDEMGGTQGVGVAFLENSVGSRARPARRVHEQAARSVLAALLPQAGQIKDSACTRSELLEASNYASRQNDFDELMQLLDVELRLLTPARSADDDTRNATADSTSTHQPVSEPVYQLTHDFLVPSIREWLECELRETRRGRARLMLQEQAELWNSRPSKRSLPSLLEWVWLRLLTHRHEWTRPQRRMMQAASRRLLRQTCVVTAVLLLGSLAAATILRQSNRLRKASEANVLLSKLVDVDIDDVPEVVDEMAEYREWIDPLLAVKMSDEAQSDRNRIRAAVASLPSTDAHVNWLTNQLVSEQLSPKDFPVVQNALASRPAGIAKVLRQKLADDTQSPRGRFRTACALVAFDDSDATWDGLGNEIATSLLLEPAAYSTIWIETLKPVSQQLREPIISALADAMTLESARIGALALYEFDEGKMPGLVDALVVAQDPQYRAIVEQLRLDPEESLRIVRQIVAKVRGQSPPESELDGHAERLANLIVASFELGDELLLSDAAKLSANPRLRTSIVHAMRPERIDLATLLPLILESNTEQPLQSVAMSAAWHHVSLPLSEELNQQLTTRLLDIYRGFPNAETHSVAGLLLRKLGVDLADIHRRFAEQPRDPSREWYVNHAGQAMVALHPKDFELDGYTAPAELNYPFAISACEVTYDLFRQFSPGHSQDELLQVAAGDVPATNILGVQIAGFCNWLSARDNIKPEEYCYPQDSELSVADCHPTPDFLSRAGYRLPTAMEWEFACRGGTQTARFFGEDAELMQYYGWDQMRSGQQLQRVAQLLPNVAGLFDLYGNAAEICILSPGGTGTSTPASYVTRGDSCLRSAARMLSADEQSFDYRSRSHYRGFRVVRTLTGAFGPAGEKTVAGPLCGN